MTQFETPLTFPSGAKIKNRLVMAPMTIEASFHNGVVTEDEIDYYALRAKNMGALITGAANVQDLGRGWPGELTAAHDAAVPRLIALTKAVHSNGAKIILQIVHVGNGSNSRLLDGQQPVCASAVAADKPNAQTPRALTGAEVTEAIKAYAAATRRAIQAGFDGVEIHGTNTDLMQQFFSPYTNRRTDEWGGDYAHRTRFIKAVVAGVRQAIDNYAKQPFILGYRFSPEESTTPGIAFKDELQLLNELKTQGLDYFHASIGDYNKKSIDPNYQDQSILGYVHEMLAGTLPLIGVGGIRSRADVTAVLATSELAAVGKQMLVDPAWGLKMANRMDRTMVTQPIDEAINNVALPNPLYDFVKGMYR